MARRKLEVERFGAGGVTVKVADRVIENLSNEEARELAAMLLEMTK